MRWLVLLIAGILLLSGCMGGEKKGEITTTLAKVTTTTIAEVTTTTKPTTTTIKATTTTSSTTSTTTTSSTTTIIGAQDYSEYYNPGYGFSFDYPSDWIKHEKSANADIIFTSTEYDENLMNFISVNCYAVSESWSLENAHDMFMMMNSNQSPAYATTIHSIRETALDGNKAMEYVYTIEFKGLSTRTKYKTITMIKDSVVYTLEYASDEDTFPTLLDSFNEMAESFDVKSIPKQLVYVTDDKDYRFEYPYGWEIEEDVMVHLLSPFENEDDYFRENVGVSIEDLSSESPITLEEYYNSTMEDIKKTADDYKAVSKSTTTVAGQPAIKQIITYSFKGMDFKQLFVFSIIDDKGVNIVYTATPDAYDKYLDDANIIIQSFGQTSSVQLAKDEFDGGIIL